MNLLAKGACLQLLRRRLGASQQQYAPPDCGKGVYQPLLALPEDKRQVDLVGFHPIVCGQGIPEILAGSNRILDARAVLVPALVPIRCGTAGRRYSGFKS